MNPRGNPMTPTSNTSAYRSSRCTTRSRVLGRLSKQRCIRGRKKLSRAMINASIWESLCEPQENTSANRLWNFGRIMAEHKDFVSKARLDALTDGVFAFAMTLLVVKFELPEDFHAKSAAELISGL